MAGGRKGEGEVSKGEGEVSKGEGDGKWEGEGGKWQEIEKGKGMKKKGRVENGRR
jgi:hypothetical protein